MNARQFYESMLITDANSVIDTNKTKHNRFELWKFAEAYHKAKNCNTPAVSNRREQLIAFLREYHTSMLVFAEMPDIETIVDDYLKSN